uniref:Uncharacterized protein n=1 Tax=Phaeomonas parva TaxID=124430 RepID=A0A6U4KPI1_9STRA|mmetsp:Transcript_45769/g.143173  ORF Transcript_45769/g.143173 Transcript_45769/m.143173 type:complete len:154 (+) Transcript_45769:463-924(+)
MLVLIRPFSLNLALITLKAAHAQRFWAQGRWAWLPRWLGGRGGAAPPRIGVWRAGQDVEFAPGFGVKEVDLGAVLFDPGFVHAHGLTFAAGFLLRCAQATMSGSDGGGRDPPEACGGDLERRLREADGHFFAALAQLSAGRVGVVPRTLFVHQ